jgi:aromatic amino acid transport protein
MSIGKFIGCVMMVVGSAIGAGILATPMVSAFSGFVNTVAVVVFLWVLLTFSGLLVVELSASLPVHACSFDSMAQKTLGPFGRSVTWISCLLMLYSTLAAYISGESSVIIKTVEAAGNVNIPSWICAVLFTVIMGFPVFLGTRTVDYFNRVLIGAKGGFLVITMGLILLCVKGDNLLVNYNVFPVKPVLASIPVIMCTFNYHFVIPSLRIYVGDNKSALRWIVVCGTTISLIVYLLWLVATLGAIPLTGENSFTSVFSDDGSVGEFTRVLTTIVSNKWAKFSINGFANISMTTSFLGISLGLFDFLADGFKRSNDIYERLQTAALTFILPFLFALFYPAGFVMALSYSAVFISILFVIMPVVMVYRLRKGFSKKTLLQKIFIVIPFVAIILVGLSSSVLPISDNMGLFK